MLFMSAFISFKVRTSQNFSVIIFLPFWNLHKHVWQCGIDVNFYSWSHINIPDNTAFVSWLIRSINGGGGERERQCNSLHAQVPIHVRKGSCQYITGNNKKILKTFTFLCGNVCPDYIMPPCRASPAQTIPFCFTLKQDIPLFWVKSHRWMSPLGRMMYTEVKQVSLLLAWCIANNLTMVILQSLLEFAYA
jgi:hypothetical protein